MDLTAIPVSHGVLLLTPVRLAFLGVQLTHAPMHAMSATTSFVAGVKSICESPPIVEILLLILGFIVGTTIGRVHIIKTFSETFRFFCP